MLTTYFVEPLGDDPAVDAAIARPEVITGRDFGSAEGEGDDWGTLVRSVNQIPVPGVSSPVYALDNTWTPIVAGDDDTQFPRTLVMARTYGQGRIVAIGNGAIFLGTDLLDTGQFLENVVDWLSNGRTENAYYTTGHLERTTPGYTAPLVNRLALHGRTLEPLAAPVTPAALASSSTLIVPNAWSDFSEEEVQAIHEFVLNGGGLCLVGLGWSWPISPPEINAEDYPMNRLGERYGVAWLRTYLTDTTNQYEGASVFYAFYPNLEQETIFDAIRVIDQAHAGHPADLVVALETDAALREAFCWAHWKLAIPTKYLPRGHFLRQQVFDYYRNLITTHPELYARTNSFDSETSSAAWWVRERFGRTWRDCLELTPEIKNQVIADGQLAGRYRDIFEGWGIVILDNLGLDERQQEFVFDYLTLVPEDLFSLQAISVWALLRAPPIPAWENFQSFLALGERSAINIAKVAIGQAPTNPFPDDVAPSYGETFCTALAHELNHVVNDHTIQDPSG